MDSFFSRYRNALMLMLMVLAQVILLAMQVRRPAPNMQDGHNIRLWRYWVASLVTPPEKVTHGIGLKVRGVWANYIHLRNLREQNEALEAENTRLRLEQASLAEDAREGQRLREMLDFRSAYIDTTVPAQVIGTSGTDQAHVIYIDKGSKDGIRPQMAVITPDGVVGKVKNVFPGTSQVLLISDQTSGAGVMLQTTRIRGVLKGGVSGQPQIINISPDERILPGEVVLTSGGDQVYPRGLPVGVVDSVVPDPDTSYVNVVVKPNANLQKLEEVMVITQISDKAPFGQEKDMMQSEVDAYAEKQRAADILSEKLPSLQNAETAESTLAGDDSGNSADAGAAIEGKDPGRPMRPPQALRPDRYTPGAAPAAAMLTPGQGSGVKYPATGTSETAASKPTRNAGTTTAGGTATVGDGSANTAVPKSRFPVKTPPPLPANVAANPESGSAPAATAATSSASSTGNAAPRAVTHPAGSGFTLPVQPADSNAAARRAAAAAANAARTATGAAPLQPSGTASVPGATRTANPAGATTATARPGVAASGNAAPNGSSTVGTIAPRRPAISSDNGGILTPAGMGSPISAPRPRPVNPAAGTTSLPAANGAATKPRPQTARPPTTQTPAPKPQAAPPGGL